MSEKYSMGAKLGHGTFGDVYKATNVETGGVVAIKKMLIEEGEGVPCTTLREVALLSRLSHPNIVHMVECICTKTALLLVLEYCDSDLRRYIKGGHLGSRRVRPLFTQILEGVVHLHSHGIIHRDLKPANILVRDGGNLLRIGDFGLGRQLGVEYRSYTPTICTIWYRPPEVMLGMTRYGPNADTWACGCILSEMMNWQPLFPGDTDVDMLSRIFTLLGTPSATSRVTRLPKWDLVRLFPRHPYKMSNIQFLYTPYTENSFIDLVQRFLDCDFMSRITASEALNHPYIRDSDHDSDRDSLKRSRSS